MMMMMMIMSSYDLVVTIQAPRLVHAACQSQNPSFLDSIVSSINLCMRSHELKSLMSIIFQDMCDFEITQRLAHSGIVSIVKINGLAYRQAPIQCNSV